MPPLADPVTPRQRLDIELKEYPDRQDGRQESQLVRHRPIAVSSDAGPHIVGTALSPDLARLPLEREP
jgi:hypothetical protein